MIEQLKGQRVPPHVAIRQEIAQRRRSTIVMASGLGPVLDVLDAYVVATESRLAELEQKLTAKSRLPPAIERELLAIVARGEVEGESCEN